MYKTQTEWSTTSATEKFFSKYFRQHIENISSFLSKYINNYSFYNQLILRLFSWRVKAVNHKKHHYEGNKAYSCHRGLGTPYVPDTAF